MKRNLPALILFVLLIVIWQINADLIAKPYILPSPLLILREIWVLKQPLFTVHLLATLKVAGIGFIYSIALGLGLAILMDRNRIVRQTLYPLVVVSQTIPTTAIAPLFILWCGYGLTSKVLVTVLITFFAITITVYDGLQATKREQIELLQTMGASAWQIFLKLKLPTALPSFFSALKMAIPISIIGAAIGEWLGAQAGLGYFSRRMLTQLNGPGVFAPIILMSVLAVGLVTIVSKLEKIIIKGRQEL